MQKNTMEAGSEPAKNNAQLPHQGDAATDSRHVLSQILRDGAQRMLQVAIQKEVEDYLQSRFALPEEKGHKLIVRNGFLPKREVSTPVIFQKRCRRSLAKMLKDSQQQQSPV